MQINNTTADGWFKRRMMRMTRCEKWAVNDARHAEHTIRTALSLLEHAALPAQPQCLEIGCGQGALARLLVKRLEARVIASDADPGQVALARSKLADMGGQIELRVIDARRLPFEAGSFDAVFSFGVLHHIPGDWGQVVAEVKRVLEPSGWFLFTDLPLTCGAGRVFNRLFPRFGQLEESAMLACLDENGFQLEHYAHGGGIMAGALSYCMGVAQSICI